MRISSRRAVRLLQPPTRIARAAFTLVEMMLVLAIIVIMTSMLVVALAGAQQDSNRLRSAAQVRRIDSLVQERWEELQYQPIRLLPANLAILNLPNNATNLTMARGMKREGVRELYRMELPDCVADLANLPGVIEATPSFLVYRERVLQAYSSVSTDPAVIFGTAPLFKNGLWSPRYEGAECLFLILSAMQDEDGDMLRFFSASEIGDVDGDGMPEILDQWGLPIVFIRWAPGFASPLQTRDPATAPDPLDPYKTDARWVTPDNGLSPYLLMPLVFSAGPDGEYGFWPDSFDPSDPRREVGVFRHDNYVPNDPYVWDSGNSYLIGTTTTAAGDNIDNHWDIR